MQNLSRLTAAALAIAITCSAARAAGPGAMMPVCEPGYTLVEEICYKDVVTRVCRVVPDVKRTTRWVYSSQEEWFCPLTCPSPLARCLKGGCCDADCPVCDKPRRRKRLVKRLVIEEQPISKCIVEETVERVPYRVYRKVPCGTQTLHPTSAPTPAILGAPVPGPGVRP